MIRSFRDKETEKVLKGEYSKQFQNIAAVAKRRLLILESAEKLADLAAIPGNRLEMLTHRRKGQYSIRINQQYRVCFGWEEPYACDVEIVDYHDEKK